MKNLKPKDKSTVKLSILADIAIQNLIHKKLRTLLTLFGIAIGIGAIYFLLSFGLGIQKLVTDEVIGNQSIRTIDVRTPNSTVIKLDQEYVRRISEIPDVKEIGKSFYFPGSFKLNNSESDTIVYGIDKGYEKLTYLNLIKGKNISEVNDVNSIIINVSALESAGLAKNVSQVIGQEVNVIVPLKKVSKDLGTMKKTLKIVGVIDSGSGAEIFIPSTIFQNEGVNDLVQMKIGVDNVEDVSKVRSQVENMGFETTSPVDTLNEINKVFKLMNIILIGFGSIGMIIAVLGMFNTLTISLLERTREIGLMVALGARSKDMRRLFIFEALLLSNLGAVVGILGAFFLGLGVNTIMNTFASRRGVRETFNLFSYPTYTAIGVIAFMMLVGLLVVILPAIRAQRINPIDALRRE